MTNFDHFRALQNQTANAEYEFLAYCRRPRERTGEESSEFEIMQLKQKAMKWKDAKQASDAAAEKFTGGKVLIEGAI